ncbi:MAG: hypothetical protein LBU32_21325 [Clostridiales bacterium]|nr:hypothetical protein [Clostridiales bacterium]
MAEALQEHLGVRDFNDSACIGAPSDLSIIDKYKEAGLRTIGLNAEVWAKEQFDAICPAKATFCGGYENWIKATEYAVQVFGNGKVRANYVIGLQPKERLMEGI